MVIHTRLALAITAIVFASIQTVEAKGLMFPFGANNGDTEGPMKNDATVSLELPVEYGFYGKKYGKLNINENGVFTFDENILEKSHTQHFPLLHDVVIAIYWTDHNVEADVKDAHIWYRNDDNGTLLARANEDIANGFGSCADGFNAQHLTIATWQNVAHVCMKNKIRGMHTYQMVYVTDGKSSFIYFNFVDIDCMLGCPVDNPITVGFNAGPDKFYQLPYSGTDAIEKLANQSNVGVPGRWMYRVDGNAILDPQCNKVPTPSFHPYLQDALNAQIHTEMYAANVYLSIAMYFDRPDVALQGFYNFFMHAYEEEYEHAQMMMKYMNTRGGDIVSADIAAPDTDTWGSGIDAMNVALHFEIILTDAILELHALALKLDDPQFARFLSEKFLTAQEEVIALLRKYITQLEKNGPGLGEFLFDQDVLQKSTGLSERK